MLHHMTHAMDRVIAMAAAPAAIAVTAAAAIATTALHDTASAMPEALAAMP